MILGAFTIQALKLWKPLNLISLAISFISFLHGLVNFQEVIKGTSNLVSYVIFWGALSILIDAILRCIFIAYIFFITNAYVLLIFPVYFVIVFFTTCVSKKFKAIDGCGKYLVVTILSLISFPFSSCESTVDIGTSFRSLSKGTFSVIFTLAFTFGVVATNTAFMADIGFSLQNSTALPQNMISNCTDICLSVSNNLCNERWKDMDQSQHQIIQIVLISLFFISILEWILESLYDFMPYKKLWKIDTTKSTPEYFDLTVDARGDIQLQAV